MKIIFFAFTIISVACSAYAGPYDGLWAVDNFAIPAYIFLQQNDFGTVVGINVRFSPNGDPFFNFGIGDISRNIAHIALYGAMDFNFFPTGGFVTINFAGRSASFTTTGLQNYFLLTGGPLSKIFP